MSWGTTILLFSSPVLLDWASADICFSSKKGCVILRPWPAPNRPAGSPGFLEDPWLTKQLLHPLQQTGLLSAAPALLSLTNKARHLKPGRTVWTLDSQRVTCPGSPGGSERETRHGPLAVSPLPFPHIGKPRPCLWGCHQSFVTKIKYWHLQTAYFITNLIGESE